MHHHIVALERIHQPLPESFTLPPGDTHELTIHEAPDSSKLKERVKPATILIVTTIKLDAETLSEECTPNLKLVAVMATGTDPVDLEACKKRGISVCNCPAANLDAVSEHAISLYFAGRRRTVIMDRKTREVRSEWVVKKSLSGALKFRDGRPPLTCKDEVMGVIGYGSLGKRIAGLGKALGMQVLVASRKGATSNGTAVDPHDPNARVPFDEVLRRSTVLALSLPRNPETLNLLSTNEFEKMHPYAVLINIARGGIVNEEAVVKALQEGRIAGYGTDVFEKEPVQGPEDCPLFSEEAKDLNITVSPHLAWFAGRTLTNLGQIVKDTVEAWVAGKPINVVV